MLHCTHPPPLPTPRPNTTLLRAFFTREHVPLRRAVPGQGLVEYGLILMLVTIVAVGAVTLVGGTLGETYFKITCSLDGEDVVYSKKQNGSQWRLTDKHEQAKIIGCVGKNAAGNPIMRGWRRSTKAEEVFNYPPNIQGGDASEDS